MGLIFEKSYPFTFAILITLLWRIFGYNLVDCAGYNNALDSGSTMCSIMLGFIFAVLPIILAMRGKNKYVDRILKSGGMLLYKYCFHCVIVGFALIIITIMNYFRDDVRAVVKNSLFYLWFYLLICFAFCCYRCIKNMIAIVLSNDDDIKGPEKTPLQIEYEENQK